ncbi:MAG: hypothetical protein IJI34_06425 [Clostridia bacterium]|nr:hypothetical protein [Clostridia bacterium]
MLQDRPNKRIYFRQDRVDPAEDACYAVLEEQRWDGRPVDGTTSDSIADPPSVDVVLAVIRSEARE